MAAKIFRKGSVHRFFLHRKARTIRLQKPDASRTSWK